MNINLKNVVRDLRKNQTECEKLFWKVVRNRKINGFKFVRQHPISYRINQLSRLFIADFYCAEKKLVVEIDGETHKNTEQYDLMRSEIINALGISVLRISNRKIRNDLTTVIKELENSLCLNPL